MWKRIVHGTLLFLLLASTLALMFDITVDYGHSNVQVYGAKTWIVDDNGSADFHTIQGAINAANNGDTIFVKSGVYYEHVNLNKTLLVIAENRNNSIVDAGFSGTAVNVTANGAWIDDLAVRNAANSGISLFGDNARISGVGVYFNTSSGFPKQQIGIDVHSSGNLIEKCYIVDSQSAGIALTTNSSEKDIRNNLITASEIAFGGDGVVLWNGQIPSSHNVYGNRIIGNIIHNNADNSSGINMHMTYGNTIAYNTIMSNSGGIWSEYSYSLSGFSGNSIHHNNFINNSRNVVGTFQSINSSWDDGSQGNYWSNYTGIDANHDGIGDSPLVFDTNNKDNYPFMRPVIQGDANHDGIVDIDDASLLGLSWLSRQGENGYSPHVDFNLDGIIDITDAAMIGINWQKYA